MNVELVMLSATVPLDASLPVHGAVRQQFFIPGGTNTGWWNSNVHFQPSKLFALE